MRCEFKEGRAVGGQFEHEQGFRRRRFKWSTCWKVVRALIWKCATLFGKCVSRNLALGNRRWVSSGARGRFKPARYNLKHKDLLLHKDLFQTFYHGYSLTSSEGDLDWMQFIKWRVTTDILWNQKDNFANMFSAFSGLFHFIWDLWESNAHFTDEQGT